MSTKKISDKEFDIALKAMTKSFGEGFAKTADLADIDPEAIPTGHDDLDEVLTEGAHGIILGGIVELIGSYGSGKTSLAMRIVKCAQDIGHRCAWFDAEYGWSPTLARLNRVDTSKLLKPDLVEKKGTEIKILNAKEILGRVYQTIQTNVFGVVVLDSVAGLATESNLTKQVKDPNAASPPGELALAITQNLPKLAAMCDQTKTTLILINQLRVPIQIGYQGAHGLTDDRYKTPGGSAIKYFIQQCIAVEKVRGSKGLIIGLDDQGIKQVIGHWCNINVVKNRKAAPLSPEQAIQIGVYYKDYFPDAAQICLDTASKLQVVTSRKGVLTWKREGEIYVRKDGAVDFLFELRQNEDKLRELCQDCCEYEEGERNLGLNSPVKVPASIRKIAQGEEIPVSLKYAEPDPDDDAGTKKKTKKRSKKSED